MVMLFTRGTRSGLTCIVKQRCLVDYWRPVLAARCPRRPAPCTPPSLPAHQAFYIFLCVALAVYISVMNSKRVHILLKISICNWYWKPLTASLRELIGESIELIILLVPRQAGHPCLKRNTAKTLAWNCIFFLRSRDKRNKHTRILDRGTADHSYSMWVVQYSSSLHAVVTVRHLRPRVACPLYTFILVVLSVLLSLERRFCLLCSAQCQHDTADMRAALLVYVKANTAPVMATFRNTEQNEEYKFSSHVFDDHAMYECKLYDTL